MVLSVKRAEIKLWQSNAISGVELSKVSQSYHRFPKHFHDTYAVHLHESGTMIFSYGRAEVALKPGSINLIHPGVVHSCLPGNEQPLSYRCLFLSRKFMDDYMIALGKKASCPAHISLQDSSLFSALSAAHRRLEVDDGFLGCDTILALCVEMLVSQRNEQESWRVDNREPKHIKVIRDFLHAHYNERVSLACLADVVGLNPVYLVRSFRSCMGMPPHAYQTQLRISHARNLLRAGTPPAEVAALVGFADQSHLTRLFKQTTGVTPAFFARSL